MREIKAAVFLLFFVMAFGLLSGCGGFKEILSEPIQPWDSRSYKFRKEVRPEIQKKMVIVIGNKEICLAMKRMESSIAPWQKILVMNLLNEIVVIELGFETRNDYWSPNLKKFNSIVTGVIPPKKAMLIVLSFNRYEIERRYGIRGRYLLVAEAHQKTATGEYLSGENVFYLDLGYRKIKEVDCGKFKCKVSQIVKLTRYNLRRPLPFKKSRRSIKIIPEPDFIRYNY